MSGTLPGQTRSSGTNLTSALHGGHSESPFMVVQLFQCFGEGSCVHELHWKGKQTVWAVFFFAFLFLFTE